MSISEKAVHPRSLAVPLWVSCPNSDLSVTESKGVPRLGCTSEAVSAKRLPLIEMADPASRGADHGRPRVVLLFDPQLFGCRGTRPRSPFTMP